MLSRSLTRWSASAAFVLVAYIVIAWLAESNDRARAQAQVRRGVKKCALLVGVDRYGKGTLLPGLGDSPRHDVEGMAEALGEIGYAKDDITMMTLKAGAEDPDLLPNAEPIRNQLNLTLAPLGPGDSVVVMLVGHGVMLDVPPPGGGKAVAKSVFCPMDANLARRDLSRFLPLDEVFEALKDCKATSKLLLADACRNEMKTAPPEARAPGIEMPKPAPPPPSVAALFSCGEKEVSWQDSTLGGGHGVFSHFVIEGLKGAADREHGNGNDEVTLDELTGYVRQNVFQFVRERHATSQMPQLKLGSELGLVVLRDRVVKPVVAVRANTLGKDVNKVHNDEVSGPEFLTSSASGIKLKRIPAGTFLMGSSKDRDAHAYESEMPQHEVRISRAFYLGVTEVTQGQYSDVTGENPSILYFPGSDFQRTDDLPVVRVKWYDAVKYCNALSTKEGLTPFYRIEGDHVSVPNWKETSYRLPTEAEWEYACRAGPGGMGVYSFGDDADQLDRFAWLANNSNNIHPVGQKAPNAWGLYDMHGNVSEWCWDEYADYKPQAALDPSGPLGASVRVLRGGGWFSTPEVARSAYRIMYAPGSQNGNLGFRVARVRAGF